jgi:hypothetical protein
MLEGFKIVEQLFSHRQYGDSGFFSGLSRYGKNSQNN